MLRNVTNVIFPLLNKILLIKTAMNIFEFLKKSLFNYFLRIVPGNAILGSKDIKICFFFSRV